MSLVHQRLCKAGCCLVAVVAMAAQASDRTSASPEARFVPLFNGMNLDGWQGDPDLWKVADGVIVGSTDNKKLKHNSFLATTKPYKNFVLKAKFKLRNYNSGIQFRSEQMDDYIVKGYQADIADNQFMGILYEERGRGILANVKPDEVAAHFKKGDWNQYVITTDGPHIKLQLNGFTTVDYQETSDQGAKQGIIALQIHAGPKMQVEFKDLEIRELP
ncbi:MAG: DUF1080 domain-containing protein [Pirellulales bacterium]|nr:DUF1080 domain-containing protein [Pirellulales bacterium]